MICALKFYPAEYFSRYNQDTLTRQKVLKELQKIVDTQEAMFIYVIEPYDFYKLDENHLFITIADVSGKGVPAALFMVAAITNLRLT